MTTRGEGFVVAGRFRCDRVLKSAPGVTTWRAVDLEHGEADVVVKTVEASTVSPAVRLRIAHEALILRRLARPGFHAVLALGEDGDLLYLVQPFVPGITLQARLAESGPLSVTSALRVGVDVLGALQHAHDGDVLHRDVKPANVIVDDREPSGGAVLIDFGFARSAWLDPEIRDEPVGTVRYLEPEATGALAGAVVDERADLYGFGVLLFENLAGRPPFDGRDVGEVLRQHLNVPAPSLRNVRDDVPRAVDGVVQRLLKKDPDDRYQSAAAVLADLETIAAALERGLTDPAVVIGTYDRRQALTEPSFVGRVIELTELVEQTRAGHGGLVLVEAESGGGKTRLLDELAQRRGPNTWILHGQGVDQAAQRPFQVLDGVARDIVRAVAARPGTGDVVRHRLGDRADAAVAALPELGPVLAPEGTGDVGPEAYGEIRSVDALSALLDALGDAGRPAVVVLDDCQWADQLSLRLLATWAERAAASRGHVLVLAAFRSEEVGPHSVLRTIPNAVRLELSPFDARDVRQLAESMAGPLPAEVVDVVAQLSEGSPFMVSAVLRGLVESGALVDTDEGWHVDPALLANAQTSRRAALFLVRRLELLSPPALALLSVGAVLGKEFDLPLAVELAGQDGDSAASALKDAARRRILWVDEKASRCSFRHDKLREALLARLSDAERRALHLRAALRLEVTGHDRPFELAYHFDAGGRSDRALPYALRAAEEARGRHARGVAVAQYRLAERATATDAATRARVAEGLGDVLTLQGEYEDAVAHLEEAKSLVKGAARRAALRPSPSSRSSRGWACGSPSTTSARATRRSVTCAASPSTSSRSTVRSSPGWDATSRTRRSSPASSGWPTPSGWRRSPRASRRWSSWSASPSSAATWPKVSTGGAPRRSTTWTPG